MAQFFITRPVFAWVVSILIMVLGALAVTQLPVAQYPNVAPPSISVTANYAGASAETLQETVTSVIEQQLNGIDNLLYMSSNSDAAGLATVTLYFLPGTNPDTAQVQVQNKVQLATPSLPQTVQQQGVVVAKATRNFMMFFTLSTTDDSLDEVALGNYIASSVLDPIRRVTGSAKRTCSVLNTRCAFDQSRQVEQLWPDRADVTTAVQNQNTQVPVGQIGATPQFKDSNST
jgi:multidrug efflux pump